MVRPLDLAGVGARLTSPFKRALDELEYAWAGRRYQLLSFDLFDTLLLRLAPPHAVEREAARRLAAELALPNLTGRNIDDHRRAFVKARERGRRFREVEWRLEDWLRALADSFSLAHEHVVEVGVRLELAVEFETTTLANNAEALINSARRHADKLIVLSDTPHTEATLRVLLGPEAAKFDAVFTSGDIGKSKRFGSIFNYLTHEFNVSATNCLHVGDHWKSDFLRPRQNGWNSLWIRSNRTRVEVHTPRTSNVDRSLSRQLVTCQQALTAPAGNFDSVLSQFGYDLLAPLLALFSIFQAEHFQREGVDAALFMARDARLILDSLEALSDELGPLPTRHYLRLSRRAVTLAHPDQLLLSLRGMAGKAGKDSVAEFLGQFVLPSGIENEICGAAGLSLDSPLSPENRTSLGRAIRDREVEVQTWSERQRADVGQFVKVAVGRDVDCLAVVDTGWAGTTQDALTGVLPEQRLVGCYLGVSSAGRRPEYKSQKFGLLRDDYRPSPQENALDSLAGNLRVWDLVMREPVPTVRELRRIGGDVVAMAAGLAPSESAAEAFNQIRDGLLAGLDARRSGVRALRAVSREWDLHAIRAAASAVSRQLAVRPTRALAKALLALDFREGWVGGGGGSGIGLGAIRRGWAWYPGLLASYGLRPAQLALEEVAEVALRRRRRRS